MAAEHSVLRVFRVYAWPHRASLAAGAVFLAITNYLTVSIPGQIGAAIDELGDAAAVARHALIIAAMGAAVILVRTLSRVLFFNPGRDMEYRLRQDLFARLLAQQPSFYADRQTGDIVSRASNDISWTRALVGFGTLQAANIALAVPMTGWKMIQLSATLTAAVLVPVIVALVVVHVAMRQLHPLMRASQEQLGAISTHILETLQGVATIKGFVAEDAFQARFEEKNLKWFRLAMRLAVLRTFVFPLLALAGGLAVFLLLYVGGPLALSGQLSVGELVAFATLLAALLPPLRFIGFLLSVWQQGRAALDRIFELIDAPIERPEGEQPAPQRAGVPPALSLQNLTFAYPDAPDKPALRDVTIDIPAGATVGVFGRTGSGKSTLLALLSRLYNPPPGSIFADGADIRSLDLDAWRRRLAVVPQRPFLFSESIAANIALDDAADPEKVRVAARLAALEADLDALPEGLETVVGERGIMLSGGQRQRVALARGLYRPADLVLLDDVLSAVDHDNEARLVSALAGLGRGAGKPTTFIVSNRLSAFRYADLILVFEEGSLVAAGTHDQLAARPGVYRDTLRLQREEGHEDEIAPPTDEVAPPSEETA